jgi:hypothetical protein
MNTSLDARGRTVTISLDRLLQGLVDQRLLVVTQQTVMSAYVLVENSSWTVTTANLNPLCTLDAE